MQSKGWHVNFVSFEEAATHFAGRRVAIVGSAPSCLDHEAGFIDGHDIVVRVSNYKTGDRQGRRCDVFYSFFGNSIKKSAEILKRDGVRLCMAKLPNSKPLRSEWHDVHDKPEGVDYRGIYRRRAAWWFCDTFIPDDARFLRKFNMLDQHQPTTGFAAIIDVLDCKPASVYLTGFDFFTSKMHNVDEPWREKNIGDPICHRPDLEAQWLADNATDYPLRFDRKLESLIAYMAPA
jgi:hypothetical protein